MVMLTLLLFCGLAAGFPIEGFDGGCPNGQFGLHPETCIEVPKLQKYIDGYENGKKSCAYGSIGEESNCYGIIYLVAISKCPAKTFGPECLEHPPTSSVLVTKDAPDAEYLQVQVSLLKSLIG